jgi:hypothetical protein
LPTEAGVFITGWWNDGNYSVPGGVDCWAVDCGFCAEALAVGSRKRYGDVDRSKTIRA